MSSYTPPAPPPTFATVLASFANADGGTSLADALTREDVEQACERHGVHFAQGGSDVWSPALTVWAFLAQCLAGSKSCVAAVARAVALRLAMGLPACSAGTGAYCKARAKLPEALLRELTVHGGAALEREAPGAWRWRGRRVLLVDGTELSMPDTPGNQEAYPQPRSQKAGLGFPQMRLVALLALATAGLVGAAVGPCRGKETGETALLRALLGQLEKGDLLVAELLRAVATHRVGDRPGRVEPREVKRRRKARLMTKPRAQRRGELLGGTEAAG